MNNTIPRLRPYQRDACGAILTSVRERAGRTICVEIARQGGKNETAARTEAALLVAHSERGGTIVKTAPTLEPQLKTSYRRLADYLAADGIPHRTTWPEIHVGRASIDMRSAEPSANVAGATASLLLAVDEAQDVDPDIFDARFRPMASTTNATTVMWGTAWHEDSLLERTIRANRVLEDQDHIRRNFLYDWREVAAYNEHYERFVSAERRRLGPDNPLFTSQYELRVLPGAGRLLTPTQLHQLQGSHGRERQAALGTHYIAGLDVGGEDTGSARPHDETVLTVARIAAPTPAQRAAGIHPAEIVDHIAWRGAKHADVIPALAAALIARRVERVHVDGTGVGEATAGLLTASTRGRCTVESKKFTQQSKSQLGFRLITAVNTDALRVYAPDASAEHRATLHQATMARMETLPSQQIRWSVPEREGNDDYLISAALVAEAAHHWQDRRAIARR